MTARLKLFLKYLQGKRAGEVVPQAEILRETTWAPATLAAYKSKHYTDPFLAHMGGTQYRILRNGDEIKEQDIMTAFTQVRPGIFTPVEGMKLNGASGVYELKALLGSGAVAQVWRCKEKVAGIERAAKIMCPKEDLLDPKVIGNVRQRFIREAKNGKNLSHAHIVKYLDSGEIDDQPFLIMELAERSLATVLKSGALSLEKSLEIVRSCLLGLQYLHGMKCEHRDVKPANILQFGSKHVLGDMGIVSWSDMNPAFTSAATITRDSLQLGSWYYMAPEQRRSPHKATASSDIYALGVSWYEMLTLVTPDPADVAAKQFDSATKHATADALIRKMVAHNPADRPELAQLLKEIEDIRIQILPPDRLI